MRPIVVHLIIAARPNFIKIAPLYHVLKKETWCKVILVHTGQHYDVDMSDSFIRELKMPKPDVCLGVGSGTHAQQTAAVMLAYEQVCVKHRPEWVIVPGDVNSTMACALTAKKLGISVAHLEAGLRSKDMSMPEEINRIVTDALSDLMWTPSEDADKNLLREGIPKNRIHRVGNIMLDSYEMVRSTIESEHTARHLRLMGAYAVVTLHRPSNVDDRQKLKQLVDSLMGVSKKLLLVFPIHPRTRNRLAAFKLLRILEKNPRILLTRPVGYIGFMSLVQDAQLVITDSGGIQEETTYLGVPCLTVRETTERPITVTQGTNRLVRPDELNNCVETIVKGRWKKGTCPKYWDGHTAERVALSLRKVVQT